MATSSLKKSFAINSKKEASAFVKVFVDSIKNPPKPIKKVDISSFSPEQMTQVINARLSKNN